MKKGLLHFQGESEAIVSGIQISKVVHDQNGIIMTAISSGLRNCQVAEPSTSGKGKYYSAAAGSSGSGMAVRLEVPIDRGDAGFGFPFERGLQRG